MKTAAAVGRPDAHAGEVPVAYIELADGATVSEEQVLEWAQEKIKERAAVPKSVTVMDQIPLTAIGKIFKPALKYDAIERIYRQELSQLQGVKSIDIKAQEDKVHGTLVTIDCQPDGSRASATIEEDIKQALIHYTIRYQVMMNN